MWSCIPPLIASSTTIQTCQNTVGGNTVHIVLQDVLVCESDLFDVIGEPTKLLGMALTGNKNVIDQC